MRCLMKSTRDDSQRQTVRLGDHHPSHRVWSVWLARSLGEVVICNPFRLNLRQRVRFEGSYAEDRVRGDDVLEHSVISWRCALVRALGAHRSHSSAVRLSLKKRTSLARIIARTGAHTVHA